MASSENISYDSSITTLNLISEIFSRYILLIILVLGIIGLTLNTLIFTRKVFRRNSCVHYFLASTIANYFVIYFILPSRILSDGYNIDLGAYNLFYCKIRFYIYYTAKSLASWFIVLACFDRKMASSKSVHQRAFCQIKISRWMITITTLISLIFYGHVLVFYEIDQNKCSARMGVYRIFDDSFYLIGYSLAPPVLMFIFGIWTLINVRRIRQIAPRLNQQVLKAHKREHALIIMLFLQIILITITTVPHAIQKLYSTLTNDVPKDDLSKATTNLFVTIVRTISFVNHACIFYILTLSGKMFRKELYKILRKIFFCQTRT